MQPLTELCHWYANLAAAKLLCATHLVLLWDRQVGREPQFENPCSRGRYGNAFGVTGVWTIDKKMTMNLTLAGGSLWRKHPVSALWLSNERRPSYTLETVSEAQKKEPKH